MKAAKLLLLALFIGSSVSLASANADSIDVMVEYSLFFENYKNKQYDDWTLQKGLNVVNTKPEQFSKYKVFKQLEDVIWFMHDSVATEEADQEALADTMLYVYDLAKGIEEDKAGYYQARKAYVMETWQDREVDTVVQAYEKALELDPQLSSFYKDRLGMLYARNADSNNGYKMKALDLYQALSEADPENATWISRIEGLAEDQDELRSITKRAWDLNKEDLSKAWKYADIAFKTEAYDEAIEALEFLTQKSPDVINYWNKLASAYRKTNQTDKAISAYKKLIDLDPDNRDNYLNLALIYYKDLNQLSVARSYLQKASRVAPNWDYPVYIEAQLYEQAARNCGFEFMDKIVYQLAADTYRKAANLGGQYSSTASDRVSALKNSVPTQEDYFFRNINSGSTVKIEGKCYDWIDRSVIVP